MSDIIKYEGAYDQFVSFINAIVPQDKIVLIHDTDPDGLTAATIVAKALAKRNITINMFLPKVHKQRASDQIPITQMKEKGINKIIVVDLPFESYKGIEDFSDFKVLVLDHHLITAEKILPNLTVIKPHNLQDKIPDHQYPASYLCYTLFNKLIGVQELDWIATIGILGDRGFPSHKEFVASAFAKLGLGMTQDIYDSLLGQTVEYIAYCDATGKEENYHLVRKVLMSASNPQEVLDKLQIFAPIRSEIEKCIKEFPQKRELHGDLSFYTLVRGEYHVTSMVSTLISAKHVPKNHTLIVLEDHGDKIHISARRQDLKENMAQLMHEATKDLPQSDGGGHIPAAGGTVRKEDLEKFKENVLKIHEQSKRDGEV